MDPIIQMQEDFTAKLNSESYFQYVPVISYRKTVIKKELQKLSVWLIGKNSKVGVGVVVGQPTIKSLNPNVSTPQGMVYLPIDTVGCEELLVKSNGAGVTPEEVARAVRNYGHHFMIEGLGTFIQDDDAIQPLGGLEKDFPGCNGFRTTLKMFFSETTIPKVPNVEIAFDSNTGLATITCGLQGVTIYYVKYDADDVPAESFPGPGNAAANAYGAPFEAALGQIVRFAAFADGFQGSNVGQATMSAD